MKERIIITRSTTVMAFIAALIFLTIFSIAGAGEYLVPLDGSDKRVKPSDFGYQINKLTDGTRVHLYLTLTEEAAKSFKGAQLRLAKGVKSVVETTVGLADIGGEKCKLLKLTLDTQVIDDGELVIVSGEVKGQPRLKDFGGFRFSIKQLLALPESIPDGGTVR